MDSKRSKAGPIEPPPCITRGPISAPKSGLDAPNANLKSNVSASDNPQESSGRVSHHVRSFSYDRSKVVSASAGTAKDGLKGGENMEAHGQGSINQSSGLYIGGGKMVGPNGSPYGATNSVPINGRENKTDSTPHVMHVRSNSAGSIKIGKALGSGHWSPLEGASSIGGRVGGGGCKGENISETLSNSGSSSGGSPSQDFSKSARVSHVESGQGGSNARGLGNIASRTASGNNSRSVSSGQTTGKGNIPNPRNSGEFSIPTGGNLAANRGSSTPRHSGELNACGTGAGSSSSSPHTSGELGGGKSNLSSFSKLSLDSSNGSASSGQPYPAPVDGNIPGGRVNLTRNGGKNTKLSTSGSPPRLSSAKSSTPGLGNIRKANWIAAGTKSNEKPDATMGNILNPSHMPLSANGNILSSGHANNGKSSEKIDIMKTGVGGARLASADIMNDSALMKKGLSSCNAEEVKNLGNELYRKGNFMDALSLYERAISLFPAQASYRSNKAAALSGLGRLPEAVHECEEAVKLDPLYARAHQRAGSLYLRLGLVESSKRHLQLAGQQTYAQELQQVEHVKMQISKCIEMRRIANWKLVLRESDAAHAAGADSSPQVMGYRAEAFFKLRRFHESDNVLEAAQRVDEALTKFGITPADSFLHVLRAHLDMALGRFEEAVTAAQSAVRADSRNAEALDILRKSRTVCLARSSGNELFKLGRFFEACAAYGEGLESDPLNAVLFCNRAACRSKLGQWEKAVEDCNAALEVQPDYTKALLRRADCNAKLERWENALNDYEALPKELPGDADLARRLLEVQNALKRSKGEVPQTKLTSDVEEVSDKSQFQKAVTFPGLVVVQFIARWNDRCREILPFTEVLCKRYPAVNFVKVDVEENPFLAKTESVSSVPTFKLYKNGTKMKEMLGPSQQALEHAVQQFIS